VIAGIDEFVRRSSVTPGFFELVGVLPQWGRPFVTADTAAGQPRVAIIGEALARRLFGRPQAALAQPLPVAGDPATIVGVMPGTFRFPTAREEIWTPLDLDSWANNRGVRNIARLARGQTLEAAVTMLAARAGAVAQVVDRPIQGEQMRLRSLADIRRHAGASSIFAMLLGAGGCLLLIACANVVSLELAAAARRIRMFAIRTALGASRMSLVRVGLLEGAALLAASAAVALALAAWGTGALEAQLSAPMRQALSNPLDLDLRTMVFMLAIAAATWLLTSLPGLWRISRMSVLDGLRDDSRVLPVTRAAVRSRQLLMSGQTALTVLLLVSGALYLQTYTALVGRDKGFDASRIATIEVFPAEDAPRQGADLEAELLDRLRSQPGVLHASRTASLPPATVSGIGARPTIDDRPQTAEQIFIHFANVDPDYLTTMGMHVIEGRAFGAGSPADEVVIDERFARAHWPQRSPVGSRFRMQSAGIGGVNLFHVVGVSRALRTDRLTDETGVNVFQAYIAISPKYHPLKFVARLTDERQIAGLPALVRSTAPRSVVRIDTVDARYARLDADRRLAAAVTGGFGTIALIVATSGVFGVMAYLVAGRKREIGIRMALGADTKSVRRLVFASSMRFVALGVVVGLIGASIAAQWIQTQLFGVTPTDPQTYVGVAGLVIATGVAATWWPARRAAAVDPASTLRAE
jgi:predicted permease